MTIRHFERQSGKAGPRDDTMDLRRAMEDGPGIVMLGAGVFYCRDLAIPAGVRLAGCGSATILRPRGGADCVIRQTDCADWALRDVTIEGTADGDWQTRRDAGQTGITVSGCWDYDIAGVEIRNFNGAGLQITRTPLAADKAPFCNGGTLDRITASGNHIGVRFDQRAEYINATRFALYHNVTGCVVHAGNMKLTASNICSNVDGIFIEDKENGSHGAISNCLVNHNVRYALHGRRARYGMAFANCCFFCGTILIEDSSGINITACEVSCAVTMRGAGANRFDGNYLIPADARFEFSPETIVTNNFTEAGPWTPPRGA